MLTVSSALQDYINNPVRNDKQYVRITMADEIGGTPIFSVNLADLQNGSVSMSRRAVGSSNFDIGQSYIDEAKFTVDKAFIENTYTGNLIGKVCTIIYGVKEINEGADEEITIFTGIIPQGGVTKTRVFIEVNLDSMLSLLIQNIQELTSGTPLAMFNHIATKTGIVLSTRLTEAINNSVNNQYTFYISDDSTISTYLDLAMWLSQILGGAITTNNVGELDIVQYDHEATPFALNANIVKSSNVSEDTIFYDSCSIVIDNVETKIVGTALETNTLKLADNPLLTGIQDELLRNIIINNIYNQMVVVPIRGFSYDYNGNPLIELGDRISYNGVSSFVQCIEWGFRKTSKLEGYTIDNRLTTTSQSVKSASHSGGGGGTPSTETIGILKWINAERKRINIGLKRVIAEEYIALYANTKALLTTTLIFRMPASTTQMYVDILIWQYFDNTELPMVIRQSVPIMTDRLSAYCTVSFNTVVPESAIYETHQYRLESMLYSDYIQEVVPDAAYIDPYDIETNIIGFMASGGQPTFTGAYFCEDKVSLNTSIVDVPTNDVGEVTDTVNVTI